jgi:hypothetical protein
MVVGAAGLLAGVQLTAGRSRAARLAALVVAGAAALGVYAWMMPACTGGPLAAADPRIRAIWLNYITEMQPLLHRFPKDRSELVLGTLMLMGLGAASWLWLGRSRQRRDSGWWLLGAALFLAAAAAFSAKRMISYPSWFAIPLIAAALADLVGRVWRRPLAPGLLVVFLISPPTVLWSVDAVSKQFDKAPATKAPLRLGERCVERAAFGPLAKLPPGLVLSEIDLGPYVLVDTPHSAVQAPYHRMGHGILAANDALSARPGADETRVRALGVTYVLNCPARAQQLNHGGLGPDSLQVRLDRKAIPAWLEPLSDPKAPLQIYRVRPKG